MEVEFTPFAARVHAIVQSVPKGRVITYGDVARAAGRPGASRAVGSVMRFNPDTTKTPCHRVVKSNGTVGWYQGGYRGTSVKIQKLKSEGVPVLGDGRIGRFNEIRWAPPLRKG